MRKRQPIVAELQQRADQVLLGFLGLVDHCRLELRVVLRGGDHGKHFRIAGLFAGKGPGILEYERQLVYEFLGQHPWRLLVAGALRQELICRVSELACVEPILHHAGLRKNADGSVDVCFWPKA